MALLSEKNDGILVCLVVSVNEELYANGTFETMSIDTDEDEHSLEMQLPFIAKVMER